MPIFQDQVHIERIAEALWRKSPLGNAALMVGAGLSRNARNISNLGRMMPTWNDLAESLCEKLYPSSDTSISCHRDLALKKASATSGALRLAQEFEASFGRTELNRLLKVFAPDDDFAPSELHEDLLKLPWADVFTTNWDTLLERAVDSIVDRRYDVVRTRDDIPASQQPRIVKLHGSFPSNYPFVFTEEDYRSYRTKFAHFVNMVQQSMMENLFCLIGFSGDDPNFLHWTGWVRDNLGESAPKIYLVGWLELAPVQRRVLEDRNIVPVDLSRLPQGNNWPEECRHRYALEWFHWMLKLRRTTTANSTPVWARHKPNPPEYLKIELLELDIEKTEKLSRSKISGTGKEIERLDELRHQILIWHEERNKYAGWVVAPRHVRSKFWMYTQNWVMDVTQIAHYMNPWERLFALREIVWRLYVSLAPLFDGLIESLTVALNEIDPNKRKCFKDGYEIAWTDPNWADARDAWFEVAMALLRHYRIEERAEQFEILAAQIDKLDGCKHSLDALIYQRAMFSIQRLDYASARTILERWHVENSDHIWAIRKAGILFELGEFHVAYELLTAILPAIRRSIRRDSDDYSALSREGCAMQLIEIAEWEKRYRGTDAQEEKDKNGTNNPDWAARWKTLLAKDCDIRDEWQSMRALLDATPPDPHTKRDIKERGFDLGHVSNSRYYGSGGQFLPAYQALSFTEAAGMPPHISSGVSCVVVGSTGLGRAAIWLKAVDPELAIKILLRICTSESDELLKRVATRETVAQLKKDFAEEFANVLLRGVGEIAKTISADKKPLGKLRVAIELLSRLTLRLAESGKCKEVVDLAITLAHNRAVSGHLWLSRGLFNLLKRSIECIDGLAQIDLILPLLKLPIEGIEESTFGGEPWWTDFSNIQDNQFHSLRDSHPEVWAEAISRLLTEASRREYRCRAVRRLTFLYRSRLLSEPEQQAFAKILWAKEFLSPTGLPGETCLCPWVLLDIPAPEEGMFHRIIKTTYLTKEGAKGVALADYLRDLGDILNVVRERKQPFALSPEEALVIITRIVTWAKETFSPSADLFANIDDENEIQKINGVARLLPFVSLEVDDLLLLMARIDVMENEGFPCYQLYPSLIAQQPSQADDLIRRLKTGFAGDDIDSALSLIRALYFWLSLSETGHAALPPDDLIEEVGLAIFFRYEPILAAALQFAALLFEKQPDLAKRTIAERVLVGLGNLFDSCKYENLIAAGLADRIDIPLVRYYCSKLAMVMRSLGYGDNPVVSRWLDAAKDDPLPEIRNLSRKVRER